MAYKMYCIYAKESIDKMGGNRGKLAAMAGHAFLHSFWDATSHGTTTREGYMKLQQALNYKDSGSAAKVSLVVDTVAELAKLQDAYKDICGVSLVTDIGRTVFNGPTTVCLGLGPIDENNIGDDLKALLVLI